MRGERHTRKRFCYLLSISYFYVCNYTVLDFAKVNENVNNVSIISNYFQHELSLYDSSILSNLNFAVSPAKFNPPISADNPGEPWLKVRPLQTGDFHRGFLQILSQLTAVGNVSLAQFLSK